LASNDNVARTLGIRHGIHAVMISADFSLQENHILPSEISLEAAMRLRISMRLT
jgi:hypothetical protein